MTGTMLSFVLVWRFHDNDLEAAICTATVEVYVSRDDLQEGRGERGESCRRGPGERRAGGKHGEDGENTHMIIRGTFRRR